jgi:hypothetical protein
VQTRDAGGRFLLFTGVADQRKHSPKRPDVKLSRQLLIFDHNKDHVITWGSYIANETKSAAELQFIGMQGVWIDC